MANDLNSCSFIGRLGKDPEVTYLPSGDPLTKFSLAVGWKTKKEEGTEWINCVAFGKTAELIGQYTQKGKQLFINGKMKTRKWQDENENNRYSTNIVVNEFQLLSSANENIKQSRHEQQKQNGYQPEQHKFNEDDDIPF